MFTWICPKCGGEVPPSYNECPRCAAEAAAASGSAEEPAPAPAASASTSPARAPAASVTRGPREGRKLSPALVAGLAAIGIVALLAILYLFVAPGRRTGETAKAAPALENAPPAGTSAGSHPLAKHLEVTGIRIREAAAGRVSIQFIVVNHSAADLPPLTLSVTLRSGDRDFFEFPAKVPSLGPYEVMELQTTAKTDLKPYELPDWQMVRPQFQIESER